VTRRSASRAFANCLTYTSHIRADGPAGDGADDATARRHENAVRL
jgi:hypothetical protein